MVERCQDAAPPPPPAQQQQEALPRGAMSLGEVEEVYAELASSYREEYMMYGLAAVAAAQVLPRLVVSLWGWQPLLEPTRATSDFKRYGFLIRSKKCLERFQNRSSRHLHVSFSPPEARQYLLTTPRSSSSLIPLSGGVPCSSPQGPGAL